MVNQARVTLIMAQANVVWHYNQIISIRISNVQKEARQIEMISDFHLLLQIIQLPLPLFHTHTKRIKTGNK